MRGGQNRLVPGRQCVCCVHFTVWALGGSENLVMGVTTGELATGYRKHCYFHRAFRRDLFK